MIDSKEGLASMSFKATCINNPGGKTRNYLEFNFNIQNGIKGSLNRPTSKPCHTYSYITNSDKAPCYACNDNKNSHWTDIILE